MTAEAAVYTYDPLAQRGTAYLVARHHPSLGLLLKVGTTTSSIESRASGIGGQAECVVLALLPWRAERVLKRYLAPWRAWPSRQNAIDIEPIFGGRTEWFRWTPGVSEVLAIVAGLQLDELRDELRYILRREKGRCARFREFEVVPSDEVHDLLMSWEPPR